MGVYLLTVLCYDAGINCLALLARNLQQVPRKIPMNMTQNIHYAGRN